MTQSGETANGNVRTWTPVVRCSCCVVHWFANVDHDVPYRPGMSSGPGVYSSAMMAQLVDAN